MNNYSIHFRRQLITECLLGILNLVSYIFIFMRWGTDANLKLGSSWLLLAHLAIFAKHLHDLGTDRSQVTELTSGILYEIHNLYIRGGSWFNFHVRQELQMFGMKISTRPPTVDAANYFLFNRSMVTTVRIAKGSSFILTSDWDWF